jgi:predicted site-specific integrase-resolvase
MKAKEVMEKYQISRNTLCTWVKKGWIKVDKIPSGRYIYIDKKEDTKDEKTN